jgi:lipooligosaccharide transport system ATP-binding protein
MNQALPILSASGVVKRFGDFTAVDGVSFQVRPGECFGLLGPNGAGKTTLLKMATCFSPRTSGDLTVFGLDPDVAPAEIKNRLGVVPQTDNLDEDIDVVQNLEIYAGYFGIPRRVVTPKIASLLEFLSLESKAHSSIEELSGGLKRRLVIARALLNDPDLVVLDEPTTGLDPQVRHLIWARLRELKARGVTLVLTTHYMEEAHQLCDRLLVMDKGRVLDEGVPADLVKRHLPRFVLEVDRFEGAVPDGVRRELHGDVTFLYADETGLLDDMAKKAGENFRIRMSGLEDVFLKLTGRDLHESE